MSFEIPVSYAIHLLIIICIYAILGMSLEFAIGEAGVINLGHVAFYAIGAYTSALLTLNAYPFFLAFILAGIIPGIIGFMLSFPVSRLKGDYLALATLAFSFVVYALTLNLVSITRGPLGLPGIPRPEFFGLKIVSNQAYLVFSIFILLLSYLIMRRIINSPFGRVMHATRDDELAARVLGKNTFKVKSYALAISAFFAGIAGSLYAHYITFIEPSSFTINVLIEVLAITILGGLGSIEGSAIAAFILILLPEPLRFIGFPSSILGAMRQMIYAVILLLMLIYKPKGLKGKIELE